MQDPIKPKHPLLTALHVLIAVFVLVDAVARPIYRPLKDWIASLAFMEKFAEAVARLPRFAILVVFLIPFAIAEPLKVVGLVLIAEGHVISGVLLMAFAYLMTFLLVERIYHAGKEKLLTYIWFAWLMVQVGHVGAVISDVKKSARAWMRSVVGIG